MSYVQKLLRKMMSDTMTHVTESIPGDSFGPFGSWVVERTGPEQQHVFGP